MDKDVIRKFGSYLERASWSLVFFGLLTQVSSEFAFPSYNVVLGFWGAYCSFARHGRATFACIMFTLLAVVLDVAFCAVNGAASGTFYFALTMFVLCLLLKCVVIYAAAHFFAALGGASSMDTSLHGLPMDVSRSGHFDNLGAFSVVLVVVLLPSHTSPPLCVRAMQCPPARWATAKQPAAAASGGTFPRARATRRRTSYWRTARGRWGRWGEGQARWG